MIASLRDKMHIDFAALGGDAGYIGAAGLARREYSRQPMLNSDESHADESRIRGIAISDAACSYRSDPPS